MRSIKVLGLGLALLLGSLLPVAASAREHTTTSAVVFVAYRDDGHYYRDRDDRRCRRHRDRDDWRYRKHHHRRHRCDRDDYRR
ncbi:MAG: hypothetical protein DMG25_20275 [Acidobacteria bacterium]|nr:MAG: hypothetical protein DMG25_20275 [Acidobacteriota bacterium]PYV26072.1 MAG: hypothetical protein DMG27_07845 [Acidobacteriota bacterium]